jgi:hypothetical protein
MAKKSWVALINEWHLWPGLAVAAVAIVSTVFFLVVGLVR